MNYPIYFTKGRGARDDYVAVVSGDLNAVQALEHFAADRGLDDFTVDTGDGRVYLCLSRFQGFFYTYLDRVGDKAAI